MKRYVAEFVSFVLLVGGIILRAEDVGAFQSSWVQMVYFLVAFLPVGVPVLREAWECFREREFFNEFTLMALASVGAFYIGEYPEGVAVMLFYAVGEKLQEGAVSRARGHIRALLDVRPGDVLEVRPGERVPLDGVLLTPHATFDTAALTGESVPRLIEKDAEVLAGMIASDTVVRIRVTRPAGAQGHEMTRKTSPR